MKVYKRWTVGVLVLVSSLLGLMKIYHFSESSVFRGKDTGAIFRTELNRQKVSHIGFLKVHKAGSTTMQNLFFRFGLKHNLSILLPTSGNSVRTKSTLVEPSDGGHYDIFAVHTTYSKNMFEKILPADAVYIGIIREPLYRMISAAYYHRDIGHVKYLRRIPNDTFIHNLINNPDIYDMGKYSQTRNTMARDFGFPSSMLEANETVIQQRIEALNKEFRLVLIMESFDESLILMRRYLRWSMSDVVYLKTNSHGHEAVNLNKEEKAKFRSTCFLDYAIYDHFKQELDRKISEEGDDFWLEVLQFKSILMDVSNFCNMNKSSKVSVNPSPWNEMFSVSSEDCLWMRTREKSFIKTLRWRILNNVIVTS